jgi:serine/threonine-protein kinase PknG
MTGVTRSTGWEQRIAEGLLDIPPVPTADPTERLLADPHVPEHRRYCSQCGEPVGRGRDGRPGRTEGFCSNCGHRFSFTPKLAPGDLVAGQYEVAGCLAHGGLGWVYLARDRRVDDRWVALKGVLDTDDEQALAVALAERRFLAEVEHSNIVRIYNFADHGGHGYVVMEYVGGSSLRQLREANRDEHGQPQPMPVAHAIAFMLEILPALGHLHAQGLVYCDFKPDNAIQTPNSVKLIDLGAVQRMGTASESVYGTTGYQAPEIADSGPTVASDLFTVGRTLAVLCSDFRGFRDRFISTLPSPDDVPQYRMHDSLYRFLARATALNPDHRFHSAEEMTDQLYGVLGDVLAKEQGARLARGSRLFTAELGTATRRPDWNMLPVPLVAPSDPAAGLLATLRTDDPGVIGLLEQAPEPTVEVEFRLALALIEAGQFVRASGVLSECEEDDPFDWRVAWYRGVAAMADGDPAQAEDRFREVYRKLPGEPAPKLGLASALEECGVPSHAAPWYDLVSRTHPELTSAAFGLARCRLATNDPTGAVEALARVPTTSSATVAATAARARILLSETYGPPASEAVAAAAAEVDRLPEELAQRVELTGLVLERSLEICRSNGRPADLPRSVLGHEFSELGIRLGLEETYRELARRAASVDERIRLVDRANHVRPRTVT